MASTTLLVQRVVGLLSRPRQTLEQDGVPPPPPIVLIRQHLLPLLVVTSLALFLIRIMDTPPPGAVSGPDPVGLAWILAQRILVELIAIGLTAVVIQRLTAVFGGTRSFDSAFAAAGLAATPTILVAAIAFLPGIGLLAMLASLVYSVMLLFWGLEIIVGVPPERRGLFCTAVIVAMIFIVMILTMIFANVPLT